MTKKDAIQKTFLFGPPKMFVNKDKELIGEMIELIARYDQVIVCVEENHYKFWAYNYSNKRGSVKTFWGKIGTTAREGEEGSDWEAYDKMRDKMNKKGYVQIGWPKK